MSTKELIVDSWSNMFKNNFILKCILVFFAYLLTYIATLAIAIIAFIINVYLGLVATIALIVVFVPISLAKDKVLLDTFQGRDSGAFGFVGYGFKNIKKMWAIVGRTILKMLPLYIIKVVLFIALIAFVGYSIVGIASSVANNVKDSFSEAYIENTYDEVDSSLTKADKDIESSLASFEDNLTSLDVDSLDTDSLEEAFDSLDFSDYATTLETDIASDFDVSTDSLSIEKAANQYLDLFGDIIYQYKDELLKSLLVFLIYFIAAIVVDILITMRSLYYNYTYALAFEDDSLTARDVVEKSEEIMHGNRAKYFWTIFFLTLAVEIVTAVLSDISDNAIISFAVLIISILFAIYGKSYHFTFFNKLIGKTNVAEVAATEPAPVVEDAAVATETPVVEEPATKEEATEEAKDDEE